MIMHPLPAYIIQAHWTTGDREFATLGADLAGIAFTHLEYATLYAKEPQIQNFCSLPCNAWQATLLSATLIREGSLKQISASANLKLQRMRGGIQ